MEGPTSEQKIAANQRNSARSTGPKNTSVTRLNAATHGLLAEGVTEMDDATAFEASLQQLGAEFKPQGELESFLVRRIALNMVRLRRAGLMEAEFIRGALNPEVRSNNTFAELQDSLSGPIVRKGNPPRLSSAVVDSLTDKFQRYETAVENKLYRAVNHLERQQRLRRGEAVSAPVALDVAVHEDSDLASFGNSAQQK
jgi:hypothetical protein